eukprot:642523-Rhodomonas_salina.2
MANTNVTYRVSAAHEFGCEPAATLPLAEFSQLPAEAEPAGLARCSVCDNMYRRWCQREE